MKGLSPRTWQLVQKLFWEQAETVGQKLVTECGGTLPFGEHCDEHGLARVRFAEHLNAHLLRAKEPLGQQAAPRPRASVRSVRGYLVKVTGAFGRCPQAAMAEAHAFVQTISLGVCRPYYGYAQEIV